jgi:hypothetical protein
MCSKTEHVIELLYTVETLRQATDRFCVPEQVKAATYLEHMFDIQAKCRYIRPYER